MAKENVNHPKHYNREGGMECIDEMILVFGKEAVKHFCLCNAWKYRYRAADKNGEEDLKKSDWYLNKYKELCGDTITITAPSTYPPIINPVITNPTPLLLGLTQVIICQIGNQLCAQRTKQIN